MHATSRLLLLLLAASLVGLVWFQPLDELATAYADAGLKRSLAAFAAARGLNAVISVIQGTEVTGGAFVNVTLALGQVLDPVNDLVEQFSQLMLLVAVVFGVELTLIQMGGAWLVSGLLTVLLLVWATLVVWRGSAPSWLGKLLLLLLAVRFLVPLMAVSSELAHQAFLADRYAASQQAIEAATSELGALGVGEGSSQPWWALGDRFGERLEALKSDADRVVSHVVDLIVLFVVQTLLLPLLVLAVLWLGWPSIAPLYRTG